MHFDLNTVVQTIGLLGVIAVVFAESGLLIGFFLPGDSLLFTAGLLAAKGIFDIRLLVIGCFLAAVIGDSVGYWVGHKFGRRLFNKEKSLLFQKDHLLKAQNFYEKHGGKTIILARFMPFIRTFAPVVAGIGAMKYSRFLFYNIIGGLIWAVGVTLLGYYLGQKVGQENIDKFLLPIIGLIILLSIAPGIYHALKTKESRQKIWALLKRS